MLISKLTTQEIIMSEKVIYEIGYLIIPKVVIGKQDGEFEVIIRRLEFVDSRVVSKAILLQNGEWLNVSEGAKYPDECYLKSVFFWW